MTRWSLQIYMGLIKHGSPVSPWRVLLTLLCLSGILIGCTPQPHPLLQLAGSSGSTVPPSANQESEEAPISLRPAYSPGQLVDYVVQTGDTLPALAVHFNTSQKEIREANPIIPETVSTLPPGMPMKIPIYYESLWGSSYQILPDYLFINGPAQRGFDPIVFVDSQPGWFKSYVEYTGGKNRRGGELVKYVAENFSISPRLLIALIEYQTGALSRPSPDEVDNLYPLGFHDNAHQGLYRQLVWAANTLNNGYYGWRTGHLASFEHPDGRLERPDPWQNAASVALQYYFSRMMSKEEYIRATHHNGLTQIYTQYFGDPWQNIQSHIPGSLTQPELRLPFQSGKSWAFTGGPHTGWGEGEPLAAIDFAPPAVVGGCAPSREPVAAVADGVIVHTDIAVAILDLDGDNDEHTGWSILYLHLLTASIPPVGTKVKAGDPIGFPSCEGGQATGTHIHIARKYNGEWIPAEGPLAFNLEGWIAHNGTEPYQGTLTRYSRTVRACVCSDKTSQIQAAIRPTQVP